MISVVYRKCLSLNSHSQSFVSTWLLKFLLTLTCSNPRFAVIYSSSDGVPISFLLGSEGVAHVTSLRLSLRFQMSEEIMFIDEEVYDALSRDLIGTIS